VKPLAIRKGALGKEYADQEIICRQGEPGNCMYVIQSGDVVVLREEDGVEVAVGELGTGDVVGEMAIFEKQPRSATVRSKGRSRIMTLDKRAFLRRVHEDPSLAYKIMQKLSGTIRRLNEELEQLKRNQEY